MKSMMVAFITTMSLGTTAMAADLLEDSSYLTENQSCFQLVSAFARKAIPVAKKADLVVPVSHISITPGTYDQTFISIINVNDDYYTVVSGGDYSCDNLSLVNIQKIKTY